ncbi:MAG: FAD-dependent oxidoreductase [Elusimicrobiota bacterium]
MRKKIHPEFRPALLAVRDEGPGMRTFRFASWPDFAFSPGQFLTFHFTDDSKTRRAYSICSSPSAAHEYFEVTVGMVGKFSDRLGGLKPGREGKLVVRGPFGKWLWDGDGHAVLVSGGTGIAPFRAMALIGKGKVTICYSAKTPECLLYKKEYDDWRQNGVEVNARVTQPGTDSNWTGQTGRWTAVDVFAAANDAAAVYYLCGPAKMVQELRGGLGRLGAAPENIKAAKWDDYTDLF